jgi:hypothetical protein
LKRLLLLLNLLALYFNCAAQHAAAVLDLSELSTISKTKFESYISKKGFAFVGASYKADTIARDFDFKTPAKKIDSVPVYRSLTSFSTKEDFSVIYRTSSANELQKIKANIKKEGFFCYEEADSLTATALMFQHNDVTVIISSKTIDTLTEYAFAVRKQELPRPKEISFAEDLTAFTSHEYLKFYFGEKNVQKDIYYLSDRKVGKCSVLFPNTSRQVVFLWGDGNNNCHLQKIYIGGQLMAKTNVEYAENIPENLWRLKSGIRPGMSLYQLRVLNDAAFNFNGGRSTNTGMVATDSTGKLNFDCQNIILGCMNCNDPVFYKTTVMNSDEAIRDERILFVQTIILDTEKIRARKLSPAE